MITPPYQEFLAVAWYYLATRVGNPAKILCLTMGSLALLASLKTDKEAAPAPTVPAPALK
jgi:hypothetical protein